MHPPTKGCSEASAFYDAVPADIASLAILGTEVLEREFGGVDILQASDGVLYLLEVNYPCYFAEAQVVSGIDIAGAMIDHLLAKAASRKRPV